MNIVLVIIIVLVSGCASKLDFNDPVTFVPVAGLIKEEIDNKNAAEKLQKQFTDCLAINKQQVTEYDLKTRGNCYKNKYRKDLLYALNFDGEGYCQTAFTNPERSMRFIQAKAAIIDVLENQARDCQELEEEESRQVREAREKITNYIRSLIP